MPVKLTMTQGRIYTTSLDIAKHFRKRHDHVLRDIERIVDDLKTFILDGPAFGDVLGFHVPNFGESTYQNERGKTYPIYHLTRDGFTLLAMGFTGKQALAWKIRYLQAFNQMERKLQIQAAKSGHLQQLGLFPDLQATVANTRPTITLTQAVGIIAYHGLNIPPVTREHLARLMDKGVIAGCRENGRRVFYVDSFNDWLQQRRQAA